MVSLYDGIHHSEGQIFELIHPKEALRATLIMTRRAIDDYRRYVKIKQAFPSLSIDFTSRLDTSKLHTYHFGEHVVIERTTAGSGFSLGDYSEIKHSVVSCSEDYPVKIGKFCSIAQFAYIGSISEHPVEYPSTSLNIPSVPTDAYYRMARVGKVTIGNDVWVGYGSITLRGVTIGNGAIIGAGAVVTHDVDPYSIVVGVPAKQVAKRFSEETIERIEELKWWDWSAEELARNRDFFTTPFKIFRTALSE